MQRMYLLNELGSLWPVFAKTGHSDPSHLYEDYGPLLFAGVAWCDTALQFGRLGRFEAHWT